MTTKKLPVENCCCRIFLTETAADRKLPRWRPTTIDVSQGVPSINTDDGHPPVKLAQRRRTLHGRTTFDTDSARPCVLALIADLGSRRCRPINQRATTAPAIVRAHTRWYLTGADAHRAAAGQRKIRFDSLPGVASVESIFIKLGRRQTTESAAAAEKLPIASIILYSVSTLCHMKILLAVAFKLHLNSNSNSHCKRLNYKGTITLHPLIP